MMKNKEEIKIITSLLNECAKKINDNYKNLLVYNNYITPKFAELYTYYQIGNNWNDQNKSIREELIEELYSILHKENKFINIQITEEVLTRIFNDTRTIKETINYDLTRYFTIGTQTEYSNIIDYCRSYIIFCNDKFTIKN